MLEVTNLRSGYGVINVLWDVSLRFAPGQLTAIIGPNGAGKTTLLRAMMGLLPLSQGSVRLNGQALDGRPAWERAALRMVMVPEGRMIFRDMSVEDNLIIGAFTPGQRQRAAENIARAYAMFPRLRERRQQLAGALSGGEAQMLALARGLMSEPQLLLIDEPSLGLAPAIVNELFGILAQLKQQRRTIILVEQNTRRALELADHVTLMQSGKVVLSQAAAEVSLEHLHAAYFAR